jgi:hypothetical protein
MLLIDVRISGIMHLLHVYPYMKFLSPLLTRIKMQAFACCIQMRSVIHGKGLEEIGVRAFAQCHSLREILIPLIKAINSLTANSILAGTKLVLSGR